MNIITKSVIISETGLLDDHATQIEIDDLGCSSVLGVIVQRLA